MQAVIFGFMMPIIPLLILRSYRKDKPLTTVEVLSRYVIYTLVITLFDSLAMTVLCDENTSFWEKMDRSPSFVLKYVLITGVAAAFIALVEWVYTSGKVIVDLNLNPDKAVRSAPVRFVRKAVFPAVLFLTAALTVILNFGLIFDNVLWGDEAYAGNLVHNEVAGIFQVLTLEENHPPLYYLWLKMFAEIFGYSGPVYHFASFVVFFVGIIMALTVFRKRFGNIPTAFFVIISGLSAPCLEYNMEIRMYALAFLGIAGSYYCAYRILCGGKIAAWIGILFWALVAAYSHYYALVAAGILLFVTFVAAAIRLKGKVWIKGVVTMLLFIAAYMPWLGQLFRATRSVSGNWWMTEVESVGQSISMIACGERMKAVTLPFLLLLVIFLFLAESGIFNFEKKEEKLVIHVMAPSIRGWSAETYTLAAGILTISGTVLFAYGISFFMTPLVSTRYFYPLCAITALMLVLGTSHVLQRMEGAGADVTRKWLSSAGRAVLFLILAVLFVKGINDYSDYKTVVDRESALTEETLALIGEQTEEMELVNNGIQHIGWTVLHYYYPDAEVVNGSYNSAETDDFWYFTPDYLSMEQIQELSAQGYNVGGYGEKQLSKYPFILYHMVRETPVEPAQRK